MAQLSVQNKLVILPRGGQPGQRGRDGFLNELIYYKVITKEQLPDLKNKFQDAESLFDGLLTENKYDESQITKAYAHYMRAKYTDLEKIDPDVINSIPYRLAAKYLIVPFSLNRKYLSLAIARPTRLVRGDLSVLGEIAQRAQVKVDVSFTSSQAVTRALGKLISTSPQKTSSRENITEISLKNIEIPKDVLNKLPKEVAEQYGIIVFDEPQPGTIKVGTLNPDDAKTQEALNYIARENNVKIEKYKISEEDFNNALAGYKKESSPLAPVQEAQQQSPRSQSINNQLEQAPVSMQEKVTLPDKNARRNMLEATYDSGDTNLDKSLPSKRMSPDEINRFVATGNIPQILSAIMKYAAQLKASDIHIEAQKDKVLIRFRIDGQLRDIITLPITLQQALVARVKILAKLKIDETRIPQDGRFDLVTDGHEIDVRVSIMPTVFGEKVVLRLLDKNAGLFKIESLGMIGENYKRFVTAIEKPYGVVMVTGPTGAGKSTTLYAAINHLKTNAINIVTLEDPVEYEIPGVNQIQIKPNIGFTFAEGLGAVLRQDPNIIMVGEIRDKETANLVTHASLTGHLVLTTLHTNDASGAMPRLVNMGVEPFLIASSMNAIVGQRLVRKICQKCRHEIQVPEEVKKEVAQELSVLGQGIEIKFFAGKGCPACGGSGYSGRTGIYEVYEVDSGMEQLIIARASSTKIREYANKMRMYPMRIDGFQKVLQGITTVDEVMRATAIN